MENLKIKRGRPPFSLTSFEKSEGILKIPRHYVRNYNQELVFNEIEIYIFFYKFYFHTDTHKYLQRPLADIARQFNRSVPTIHAYQTTLLEKLRRLLIGSQPEDTNKQLNLELINNIRIDPDNERIKKDAYKRGY